LAQYLDGIQATEDVIKSFTTIASGTITVGTNQYPVTADITAPSKLYRNYILLVSNKSGQTINNVQTLARVVTNNIPVPNVTTSTTFNLKISNPPATFSTGGALAFDLTSEEPNPFITGVARFLFSLLAAPTSGTIDWALIGY
jgi:hypothetical protein